jgi:uncharacterized protein YdhG (YjbR/CyaY superfamily)
MRSEALTVEDYLHALPPDRRESLESVRAVILDHLPDGVEEVIAWGMLAYVVPLERFADTYNGQALLHCALANQKQHMSLYLNCIYGDDKARADFEKAYRETGKRYDVGKSCVRFRRLDDLPLEVVGAAISSATVEDVIHMHEVAMAGRKSPRRKRVP